MGQGRKDLREKVADKAGDLAAKAESKAGDMGLSREHAAEITDQVKAKGEKALESSVDGARHIAAGARRNKTRVAIATAATAVMAAVLAGWRVVSRRSKS